MEWVLSAIKRVFTKRPSYVGLGICRNCRWWGSSELPPTRRFNKSHKQCSVHRNICHPSFGKYYFDGMRVGGVTVQNNKMPCEIMVTTGPDFGCIHWEKQGDGGT